MANKSEIIEAVEEMIARYTRGGGPMWEESMAVLEKAPLEFARYLRKSLNIGEIRRNAAKCLSCQQVIESTHVHDYVTCKCGALSVDGGSWYCKRGYRDSAQYEDLSTIWPWID